jgi:5-methylcytosine-specific restriction endonuclease McrBC regulatory subunit McrC
MSLSLESPSLQNHVMKERVYLHISQMGYRSGLIAYTKGGKSLRILVLPKLWRHDSDDLKERISLCEDTLTIIAYETERIALCFVGNEASVWKSLFKECINSLQEDHEEDVKHHHEFSDIFDDQEIKKQLKSLLAYGQGRKPSLNSDQWITLPSSGSQSSTQFTYYLDQLLRLVLFSRLFKPHHRDYSHTDQGAGYLINEGESNADPLRLLMTYAFIKEVQRRQREVRQGYRVETANLSVIRGHITPHGLFLYTLLKQPRIECTYDEFTSQIPLFQVIVSALDHVASGASFPSVYRELPLVQTVRRLARSLRKDLAHIPSLPQSNAAFMAGQVRLKRLQRPWQSALNMARMLLQKLPLKFTGQEDGQGAIIWYVDTSKVWEEILKQILTSSEQFKDIQISEQEEIKAPWEGLAKKNADLICRNISESASKVTYVLDAKYKDRSESKEPPAPSASEQYQIFAYSHLVENVEDKVRCGLLYATSNNLNMSKPWQ